MLIRRFPLEERKKSVESRVNQGRRVGQAAGLGPAPVVVRGGPPSRKAETFAWFGNGLRKQCRRRQPREHGRQRRRGELPLLIGRISWRHRGIAKLAKF